MSERGGIRRPVSVDDPRCEAYFGEDEHDGSARLPRRPLDDVDGYEDDRDWNVPRW